MNCAPNLAATEDSKLTVLYDHFSKLLILLVYPKKKALTGGDGLLYEPLPARPLPRSIF